MENLIVVGLLGGVGSGKSTVAKAFGDIGAEVLDADVISSECLTHAPIASAIRSSFGSTTVDEAGQVDRKTLADLVFSDEKSLQILNEIVHPCVKKVIFEQLEFLRTDAGARIVVLDVPLLLGSELNNLCHKRVFVDASLNVRHDRVFLNRGWSQEELDRREKSQASIEEKKKVADYTIDNSGSVESADAQTRAIFNELTRPHLSSPSAQLPD